MAKLRHGPGEDWNEHRNDVGNLVVYVESRWKRDLTWQVVDLEKATVDDLMQAPVAYLCGSFSPLPRGETQRQELAQEAARLPRPRRLPLCRGLLRRRASSTGASAS